MKRYFSTEQVSKYHPDKYADQISDAILNYCLKHDIDSHVACETLVKNNTVVLGGEITSDIDIPYEAIIKKVSDKLGYHVDKMVNLITKQSLEIGGAVRSGEALCAGDQGIMFGYACSDTPDYLPFAFYVANSVIDRVHHSIETDRDCPFKGDAKTQITVDEDNTIHTAVLSVCHKEEAELGDVEKYVRKNILYDIPKDAICFNPAGRWEIGGPESDCGLTGRKIVCDQYGGFCAVGGGAFSGKDPSKVDRSGAYMARHIAVELVRGYGLKWCRVQLAYAIGRKEPMSVYIDSNRGMEDWLLKKVQSSYDLTPYGIIKYLNLYKVDYEKLSEGCHFRYKNLPLRAGEEE